jgi:hypothetical protein
MPSTIQTAEITEAVCFVLSLDNTDVRKDDLHIGMKGTELAKLIAANSSTVSRVLNDLKASRFLNQGGERLSPFKSYPGMFVSVTSLSNLCEMMDATEFTVNELKDRALDELDFKHDAFGRKMLEKLPTSENMDRDRER